MSLRTYKQQFPKLKYGILPACINGSSVSDLISGGNMTYGSTPTKDNANGVWSNSASGPTSMSGGTSPFLQFAVGKHYVAAILFRTAGTPPTALPLFRIGDASAATFLNSGIADSINGNALYTFAAASSFPGANQRGALVIACSNDPNNKIGRRIFIANNVTLEDQTVTAASADQGTTQSLGSGGTIGGASTTNYTFSGVLLFEFNSFPADLLAAATIFANGFGSIPGAWAG